jgi:hypothetical protein
VGYVSIFDDKMKFLVRKENVPGVGVRADLFAFLFFHTPVYYI